MLFHIKTCLSDIFSWTSPVMIFRRTRVCELPFCDTVLHYKFQPEQECLLYLADELLQTACNNSFPAASGGIRHTEGSSCRHERREQGLFCYCSHRRSHGYQRPKTNKKISIVTKIVKYCKKEEGCWVQWHKHIIQVIHRSHYTRGACFQN